jgi:hypothetical protein
VLREFVQGLHLLQYGLAHLRESGREPRIELATRLAFDLRKGGMPLR